MNLFHKSRPQENKSTLELIHCNLEISVMFRHFLVNKTLPGNPVPRIQLFLGNPSTAKRPGNDDNSGPERQLIARKTSDGRLDRSAAATTLAHTHRPLRQLFDLASPRRYCREGKMKM